MPLRAQTSAGNSGTGPVAGVAGGGECSADDLFVEALGLVAGGEPGVVGRLDPPPRRVGGERFVDQEELAVGVDAELELGVGQDQPGVETTLGSAAEQRQRSRFDLGPELGGNVAVGDDVGARERLVVGAVGSLGGRA